MTSITIPPRRQRLHRSELAVPATSERFFEKAARGDADVIFIDLEDAVALSHKVPARKLAIAALNDLLRVANLLVAGREIEVTGRKFKPSFRSRLLTEGRALLGDMGALLGFGEKNPKVFLSEQRGLRLKVRGVAPATVEALMQERAAAKQQKDFARADAVRAALVELGVEVRDTPDGVEWGVL